MGSWISHLRIAANLFNRLPGLDEVAFTFGNLAPDSGMPNADWTVFDPPKEVSHFLSSNGGESAVQDLVFYRQYLCSCKRDQDPAVFSFLMGYFVHLVSDRLWAYKIGKPSRLYYADLFSIHSEVDAWNTIKEDWYSLDQLYVRDHPDCLFWQVLMKAEIPQSPLPFVRQPAFEQQINYIRNFYSRPDDHWKLDRPFPYLNETSMSRYIEESSACLIKIFRLLSAYPPPEALVSATLLLTSAEVAGFQPPLGD